KRKSRLIGSTSYFADSSGREIKPAHGSLGKLHAPPGRTPKKKRYRLIYQPFGDEKCQRLPSGLRSGFKRRIFSNSGWNYGNQLKSSTNSSVRWAVMRIESHAKRGKLS